MSSFYKENELIFENYLSKKKEVIKEASYEDDGYKVREFNTYKAWKSAVKKLDPNAKFTGDIDIDSYKGKENSMLIGMAKRVKLKLKFKQIKL